MFKHWLIAVLICCASLLIVRYVFNVEEMRWLAAAYCLPFILYFNIFGIAKAGSVKKWLKEFF